MEILKKITVIFLLTVVLLNSAALAKSARELLQEGLYAEDVDGDLDAAIRIYEQVIADRSAHRSDIAQAMYRQGMCYLKKRDEQQAKVIFGQLVAKYDDQTKIISKVKPMLEELSNADPAALMPPETLLYMELGSLGKQIETILNMLKGTPFENPLAVIGGQGGSQGQWGSGEKSPEDMLAALLNPSMMAEFKKIRGMGVGVTGIAQNNPPFIVVLFPGKSDALRGIILAGLGMIGKPADPIEDMQTYIIGDSPRISAAYDDSVIIVAHPREQLESCIRRYKGIESGPTLASQNKTFSRISRKNRQENAVTVWVDVDNVFAGIKKQFPDGEIPQEMLWADGIVDFGDIEDVVAYLSIEETGIVAETNIAFKDGHHCLAYDLIRTPNISKAGFEAVPPEAIAIVSFALGQPDGTQAKEVSKGLKNVTGLDIGREIFANIEQVTLFALPSDRAFEGPIPFLSNCVGLAVTSHNPQQTRQILTTLLGTASLFAGDQQAGQVDATSVKYQIGVLDDQKLYCYMNQVNEATVLSLSGDITDASIAAIKKRESACTAGPLKDSISKLSPTTSKLVLINIGGAVRVATPAIIEPFVEDSQRDSLQQALTQLAEASDQTMIELCTDEQLNNFTLRSAISGLPPVNQVFGPAMEISQILGQAKAEAGGWGRKPVAAANIKEASQAPVIDATAEDLWSTAKKYKLENVIYSPISSNEDFSAYYKVMWDKDNLYMLVDVTDDELTNDSGPEQWYLDDCIEVFIDADNSKSDDFDENDYQYHFDWDQSNPAMDEEEHGKTEDVDFAMVTTEKGYRTEIKFPWSTLGTKPFAGASIGLEVHVNDDDGGDRTKLAWKGTKDVAYGDPQTWGTAELAGLVGWWKFDEEEGSTAADSSGNGNKGTLKGDPVWQPSAGMLDGALLFDGDGDCVQIENESSFDVTSQITISAWVNISSVPAEWTAIVTKGDSAWRLSTESAENGFHFAIGGDTLLNGQRRVGANEWHHVVGVYDGEQMLIYIDGKLDVSRPWDGGIESNDYPVCIGENAEQTGRFWHGLIDDVRIYNYALAKAEVEAIYNEGEQK